MGLALVMLLSIAGPLVVGRWLAERDDEPDSETRAVEAHALLILMGGPSDSPLGPAGDERWTM